MPTVLRPSPDANKMGTHELRRLMGKVLRTDSELEAFCIDHFPKVSADFGCGMDRRQKENLLLMRIPPRKLLRQLQQRMEEAAAEPGEEVGSGRQERTARGRSVWRSVSWKRAGVVAVLAVSFFGAMAGLRERAREATDATWGEHRSTPQPSEPEVDPPIRITSEPSGALVVDAATGRPLGRTPWAVQGVTQERRATAGELAVCLRKAGYMPVGLKLGGTKEAARSHHVRMRTDTQAAGQPDAGQEPCHAPTPIIP